MIECKNLSVCVSEKHLLCDISFTIKDGEVCVIIGKNGSGKTTLIRALSSEIPHNGEIITDGKDISRLSRKQRAKLISVMAQDLPTPECDIKSLVSLGRYPHTGFMGKLSEKDNSIVEAILNDLDLKDHSDMPIRLISGGEKRKVFFAMMLAQDTPILLIDEPTANLDTIHQRMVLELIKKQKKKERTILCVLHDINQALEIADRLLLIDDKRLVFNGTPELLIKSNMIETIFGLNRYDIKGNKGVIYL